MRAAALALALLLPGAALAEAPYDGYARAVGPCYDGAEDEPMARACIGRAARACIQGAPDGETTVGMMFCLLAERDAWDEILNAEYARARAAARTADQADRGASPQTAVRGDLLLDAQRAWIAFRDANCASAYAVYGAGSMRQIAGAECQMRMTADRTIELRALRQSLGDR